jgi:glycopeptide antibiotics resistance protein
MVDNLVAFVPFGLLLSANLKQTGFWRKLGIIFLSSMAAETLQYIFAIGRTDLTDVIMNTAGGFAGLAVYRLCRAFIPEEKLDQSLAVLSVVLTALLLYTQLFVFRVRY